jgi:hypothetical protein
MKKADLDRAELMLLYYALRRPQGIAVETVAQRIGLSIAQLVRSFKKLKERELLREEEHVLYLTSAGRDWVMNNQRHFSFHGQKTWREVPKQFSAYRIHPSTPYVPRLSKLSKTYFGVAEREIPR